MFWKKPKSEKVVAPCSKRGISVSISERVTITGETRSQYVNMSLDDAFKLNADLRELLTDHLRKQIERARQEGLGPK